MKKCKLYKFGDMYIISINGGETLNKDMFIFESEISANNYIDKNNLQKV
jgi:hypothetical protein